MTPIQPTYVDISLALTDLGSDVTQVAESLYSLKMFGKKGSDVSCPIATYLRWRLDANHVDDVVVSVSAARTILLPEKTIMPPPSTVIWEAPKVVVVNPPQIEAFVDKFDGGEFPQLEAL